MARFRLLASHVLDIRHGSGWIQTQLDAGYEFDSSEMRPHWQPSPYMIGLDAEAQQWITDMCVMWAGASNDGNLTGFGPVQLLPFTEDEMPGEPTLGEGGPPLGR